jgi:hypothetical protein
LRNSSVLARRFMVGSGTRNGASPSNGYGNLNFFAGVADLTSLGEQPGAPCFFGVARRQKGVPGARLMVGI